MTTQGNAAAEAQPKRRGALARLARDRRGVAALEFAMVSIPFLGLLCAIFETAFVFYTHEVFDTTVANVARQILVNQYASTTPTTADFLSAGSATGANGYSLCGSLPSYFQCANIRVNVSATAAGGAFSSLAGAITDDFIAHPSANVNLGAPGSIVVFQAFYAMPIYLSVLLASGSNGNQAVNLYSQPSRMVINNPIGSGLVHKVYSVVVFRNEPS
ncbi:Flp pilus assembly protein TadG [Rhodoblastus acidophilus]|uniref:TadE/TadG family type IV pilus assembly protein n=1 Tax=Rhodoblastus acidophilus TaxID=1074 RepID=UPI00222449A7|nr:TadE/TadG family type IV pilus assembly protein [Rhodoblastus acidophilus]MCW2314653.1 Flp pilus assembly protein TadG [Rhodoblastus acidophilus]